MQNNLRTKLKRVISVTATVILVLQGFLPGSFLGISPAQAATGTWDFTNSSNYTLGSGATVGDTYAFAELDLTKATDDLGSHGPTTDLIKTDTAGRILAGVEEWPAPYSTDYGDTWTQDSPAGGGSEVSTIKFTKITTGINSGRIIGVGYDPDTPDIGGWSYTDNDGVSWTFHASVPGSTKWGAVYFESTTNNWTWAGTNDANNEIYVSDDDGVTFVNDGSNAAPLQGDLDGATYIHDIVGVGAVMYAAATITGASSTTTSIFYTTDSGATWSPTTKTGSHTHATVYDLIISNGYVYAITSEDGYILKSDLLLGQTFSEVSISGLTNARSIYADASGGIIIPAGGGVIYRSFNNGNTFVAQQQDVDGNITYVHATIRTSDTYVYLLGTEGSGTGNAYSGTFNNTQSETTGPIVTTKSGTGVAFSSISSFNEVYPDTSEANAGVKYRFTNDKNQIKWWYWDSSTWAESDDLTKTNTTVDLTNEVMAKFDDEVGLGTFHFQAHLTNAGGAYVNASVALDSVAIEYIAGTITVTAPNGEEEWDIGSFYDITWGYTGFDGSETANLYYSINSGSNWTLITDSGTENDGVYAWQVPNDPSDLAQVKVVVEGVEDTSNANFRIVEPGGGGEDEMPPFSDVDDLDEYTRVPQFEVTVTAYDLPRDKGTGVKEVSLYYSYGTEGKKLRLWEVDDSAPFEFIFDTAQAQGDGDYYFYSTAVDWAGNSNAEGKGIDPLGAPVAEAWTTVDAKLPELIDSQPFDGQEEVPINLIKNKVTLWFSESMNKNSFTYEFYDESGNPVKNKMEDPPKWKRTKDYGANSKAEIKLKNGEYLEYNTKYTFDFYVQDVAGNILDDAIIFRTRPIIHPDITPSTIEVSDGPNDDGSYNVGDSAHYTVTLRNASEEDPAETASAELTFAPGITFQEGSLLLLDPHGSSQINPTKDDDGKGKTVGFVWAGRIPVYAMEGGAAQVIKIFFTATIDEPANNIEITQKIDIYDEVWWSHSGVPNGPWVSTATLYIAEDPDFSQSSKTSTPTEVAAGENIKYTITVTNAAGAKTASSVKVTDEIPNYTTFVKGTLWGDDDWDLECSNDTVTATLASLSPGFSRTFYFKVNTNPDSGGMTITNTASISNTSGSVTPVLVSAQTNVASGGGDTDTPPELVSQSPENGVQNVPLKSKIIVEFTKAMDPASFSFTIDNGYWDETSGWTDEWENDNTLVTLTRASKMEIGVIYTVEVSGMGQNGKELNSPDEPLYNPWSFTTAEPAVTIPPIGELEEIPVNTVSRKFVVELRDTISNQLYEAEDDPLKIWLKTSSDDTGRFGLSPGGWGATGNIDHVIIAEGDSQTFFYYIDSTISPSGEWTTISAFEDSQGWDDTFGIKCVAITGEEEDLTDWLTISISSPNIFTNQFSKPITIGARQSGDETYLPERLYFHTQSTTGAFYDSTFSRLGDWITVQDIGNPSTNLQSFTPSLGMKTAIFYYLDSMTGSYIITVSDNAPLTPDMEFDNASAVLNIMDVFIEEEEELEEDLEEVEDDTGRIIEEVLITPIETTLLPGGIQTFEVTGLDSEGKIIKELIFRWYVIGGGGTIEKEGTDGNSHKSTFEAGNKLGIFYDTVLVATLYNGKIGFAAATVAVADVVDYGGPTRLPTTGISTLQVIFIALTLAAAVALAWVTSYEKTHF